MTGNQPAGQQPTAQTTTEAPSQALGEREQQLVGQIMDYIRSYNELWAKPFKWTYTGKPLTV